MTRIQFIQRFFLQADVLESQFTALVEKIKKTQDFETINKSLDFFLIQMLMQSFVSMKKVGGIIMRMWNYV